MYQFLVKLGKKKYINMVMPTFAGFTGFSYIQYHTFAKDLIVKFFRAEDSSGEEVGISEKLGEHILATMRECRSHLVKPLIDVPIMQCRLPEINWFSTCAWEPINFGFTECSTGVLIGLPSYTNYEKPEDVPDYALEVTQMKLFKTFKKDDIDDIAKPSNREQREVCARSLVMSDEAKKFIIARELFLADTYRVPLKGFAMTLSILMGILFARAAVQVGRLKESHISRRVPIYVSFVFASKFVYNSISDAINTSYELSSDKRAVELGDSYRRGAEDYFEHLRARNVALRDLIEPLKNTFDEQGDLYNPLLRQKYLKIDDRLSNITQEEESNKSD